jgi:hypothetical protein
MNKVRSILLVLTAVAALSVAHPAKANLITNPGFETGDFTGWTLSGDHMFTNVTNGTVFGNAPHSGTCQAFLQNSFAANTGFVSQMLALAVGTTYTVDFWVAPLQSNTNSFAVSLGGVTGFSVTNAGTSGYTEHTFNFTYNGGSTELLFAFQSAGSGFLLDDISVEPAGGAVPDAGSTVSLLGCALLGLAALRRKLGC